MRDRIRRGSGGLRSRGPDVLVSAVERCRRTVPAGDPTMKTFLLFFRGTPNKHANTDVIIHRWRTMIRWGSFSECPKCFDGCRVSYAEQTLLELCLTKEAT